MSAQTVAQVLVAQSLAPTMADAHMARVREGRTSGPGVSEMTRLYRDTPHRAAMRALLNAAGSTGALVRVAFFRQDGDLRYMLCKPMAGVDYTTKYVTVVDVEALERREDAHRRVNLDSITGLQIEYRASDNT
jgi:hypothetical protein